MLSMSLDNCCCCSWTQPATEQQKTDCNLSLRAVHVIPSILPLSLHTWPSLRNHANIYKLGHKKLEHLLHKRLHYLQSGSISFLFVRKTNRIRYRGCCWQAGTKKRLMRLTTSVHHNPRVSTFPSLWQCWTNLIFYSKGRTDHAGNSSHLLLF